MLELPVSTRDDDVTLIAVFETSRGTFTSARLGTAKRGRPMEIQVDAPIKSHYTTFEDKNGNFQADPGENRRSWEVSAASSKGRAASTPGQCPTTWPG